MKTLIIVPEDNMVIVDGEGIVLEVTADPNAHSIHWEAEKKEGHIQHKDGSPHTEIGEAEIAEFLPLVVSHREEKASILKGEVDRKASIAAYEALPSTKRANAFSEELSIGDQLDEILKFIDKQDGTTKEMQEIIAKSKEIKGRFPKEGE